MPPFGIWANHKIKMCHNSMKKIMIQKITQNNWNFWTVNLIMRAKKYLTSRQIFRYAVPARTVTKKHWFCYLLLRPARARWASWWAGVAGSRQVSTGDGRTWSPSRRSRCTRRWPPPARWCRPAEPRLPAYTPLRSVVHSLGWPMGWVGSRLFSFWCVGLGWVSKLMGWVGLDRVT